MSLDDRLRRGLRAAAHDPALAPDADADVTAGRHRIARRRRRARLVTGAAVALLVVAAAVTAVQLGGSDPSDDPTVVGDDGDDGGDGTGGGEGVHPPGPPAGRTVEPAPTGGPGHDGPPPVRVSAGDRSIELDAFTYCFHSACADGMPPRSPLDIGAADELRVDFALPDWAFDASLYPAEGDCGRSETVTLEPDGEGGHVLRPVGPAGTYLVTLMGRGTRVGLDNGDAFYAFRWTTTEDGPVAPPGARLALLADHDGRVDSYGIELVLDHLAATPATASATITLRATADGREHTFGVPGEPRLGCPESGDVSWVLGPPVGQEALAAVGATGQAVRDGMFTFEVVLTLDGAEHRATATWPDDTIVGNEPSVALDFTPALPARPSP